MYTLIVILHVTVSVALILVILLQTGKGSDIGAVFGGGSSQTLFGSTGPTSFLSKLTAGAAVVFMLTSLFLLLLRQQRLPQHHEERRRRPRPDDARPAGGHARGPGRRSRNAGRTGDSTGEVALRLHLVMLGCVLWARDTPPTTVPTTSRNVPRKRLHITGPFSCRIFRCKFLLSD